MIVSVVGVCCVADRCVSFLLMLDFELTVQLIAFEKQHSVVRKMIDEQLAVVFLFVHNGDNLLQNLAVEYRDT
jgi:hypothetical protein